jgi:hypothetical protein
MLASVVFDDGISNETDFRKVMPLLERDEFSRMNFFFHLVFSDLAVYL